MIDTRLLKLVRLERISITADEALRMAARYARTATEVGDTVVVEAQSRAKGSAERAGVLVAKGLRLLAIAQELNAAARADMKRENGQ